jgi:CelD/BcsL family acetyltransferase involved in cellulose biosynthesis
MLTARRVLWRDLDDEHIANWQRLIERVQGAPDLSYEWALSLVQAHEIAEDEVHVIELRDEHDLRGIIPLRVRRDRRVGLPRVTIELLGSTFSLHLDVLCDVDLSECVQALFDAFGREYGRWTTCVFNGAVEHGALVQAIEAIANRRRLFLECKTGDASPYLDIDRPFEAFIASKSANFRSNLKRKARRFREAGNADIRFLCAPADMPLALDVIREIEDRSWKATSGTSLTRRIWEERFYSLLVTRFSPREQILVTVASLDGVWLAYDLTLLGAGRAYCLKTSFDASRPDLSAGLVLRAELMQRMFCEHIREYDFLGKNERYKLEWSETIRRSQHVRVINSRTFLGVVLAARSRLRRRS